jgi:hypothetical protein
MEKIEFTFVEKQKEYCKIKPIVLELPECIVLEHQGTGLHLKMNPWLEQFNETIKKETIRFVSRIYFKQQPESRFCNNYRILKTKHCLKCKLTSETELLPGTIIKPIIELSKINLFKSSFSIDYLITNYSILNENLFGPDSDSDIEFV